MANEQNSRTLILPVIKKLTIKSGTGRAFEFEHNFRETGIEQTNSQKVGGLPGEMLQLRIARSIMAPNEQERLELTAWPTNMESK